MKFKYTKVIKRSQLNIYEKIKRVEQNEKILFSKIKAIYTKNKKRKVKRNHQKQINSVAKEQEHFISLTK